MVCQPHQLIIDISGVPPTDMPVVTICDFFNKNTPADQSLADE
jgi:hypothetical protein